MAAIVGQIAAQRSWRTQMQILGQPEPIRKGHVSPFTLTAGTGRAEVEAWRESSDWSFLARFIM